MNGINHSTKITSKEVELGNDLSRPQGEQLAIVEH